MLRLVLKVVVVSAALALPAAADPATRAICEPARGTEFTVTGVGRTDTLNVRAGPGVQFPVVARLADGTRGLTATGGVRFSSQFCAAACADLLRGDNSMISRVRVQCLALGRIWYEVRVPRGVTGWAAARFLSVGTAPQPPKPGKDEKLRLICRSGEKLDVTLRPRKNDAVVVTGDGLELRLQRQNSRLEIDYASRDFGGVSIRGTRTRVDWIGPGSSRATLCVPRS